MVSMSFASTLQKRWNITVHYVTQAKPGSVQRISRLIFLRPGNLRCQARASLGAEGVEVIACASHVQDAIRDGRRAVEMAAVVVEDSSGA